MTPNATQLSAMTRLFSSGVFRELATKGRSPMFSRLLDLANVRDQWANDTTVADVFDSALAVLKTRGLRDEYVYRAALTEKVLMGTHSLQTASMLTEFRAGSCKADLVILNGTATVYEIKSERDSLSRLQNQIFNYRKVFSRVNIIAGQKHVSEILEATSPDVGVMLLSPRFQITTMRDAASRFDCICPVTIFESLRSGEARAILEELGVGMPAGPNTVIHGKMREVFRQLDPSDVHVSMVKVLKRTRNLAPLGSLVERLPKSLHALALSIQIQRSQHEKLVAAVETPLKDTTGWA